MNYQGRTSLRQCLVPITEASVKAGILLKLEEKVLKTTFTNLGFDDWKKAQEKLLKNKKSYSHIRASIDFVNYCYQKPVTEQLSDEKEAQESLPQLHVGKNREVMK